jgi:hypothetical protein
MTFGIARITPAFFDTYSPAKRLHSVCAVRYFLLVTADRSRVLRRCDRLQAGFYASNALFRGAGGRNTGNHGI